MTMAIERYPDDWNQTPKIPNEIPLMLGKVLLDEFDENYWREMHRLSSVHKLTYKLDMSESSGNTYYHHIINEKYIET